ncbi:MAG: sialate O-acetylesterase [Chitinophagaceae bacterium]|nr:MAG: sialate O-acetylesterase [Chitinophagaceae bacterium]
MKRVTWIFWLLLLACAEQARAQQRIKVACVGNSITEGVGVAPGKRYPEILQELLGGRYDVRNFGISARTLLRKGDFPYWKEALYDSALAWAPDIVIIKLGTNDSKPQNWRYGGEFRTNYTDFVRSFQLLASHPKVYACTPLPVFEERWGINDPVVRRKIVPAVRKVARKTKATLINLYEPFAGKAALTYDGIHPNAEGCLLLAQVIYSALLKKPAR